MRGTEILYHYRYIQFIVNKTYLLKYHCTLTLSNACNSQNIPNQNSIVAQKSKNNSQNLKIC